LTEINIDWKQVPGRVYARQEVCYSSYEDTKRNDLYYWGPEYAKQLTLADQEKTGIIQSLKDSAMKDYFGLYMMMWGPDFEWDLILRRADSAALSYDTEKNLYVYEFQFYDNPDKARLRLWIDPQRDYIPVIKEYMDPDGTLYYRQTCLDWRRTSGLWVPITCKVVEYRNQTIEEYAVKEVEVNNPIDVERMDFEFPEGVFVEDRILRIEYRTPKKKTSPDSAEQEKVVSPEQSGTLPPAATDEQLAEAASKGRQLLQQQTEAGDKKSLAIYPEYVWIEPGRKEYILTLGEEKDRRPTLKSHQFAGGGLMLHELKDQISENGQIRLTIERPAAMTGYDEGTLELDFAGEKRTIHLVAPPLFN
jgi:hypothetical protein